MSDALRGLRVEGVPTTIPLHLAILDHADFRAGRYDTRWLEGRLDALLASSPAPSSTGSPA